MPRAEAPQWNLKATVAAWLLPGLGHFLIGQQRRAVILAVTIGSIWVAGLLIGGISVIREFPLDLAHLVGRRTNQVAHQDRKSYWFLGQMLVGPTWIVHFGLEWIEANDPQPKPTQTPPPTYEPSFGHVYEQGILYTALAGLLNLLAIIDVFYHGERRELVRQQNPVQPSGDA